MLLPESWAKKHKNKKFIKKEDKEISTIIIIIIWRTNNHIKIRFLAICFNHNLTQNCVWVSLIPLCYSSCLFILTVNLLIAKKAHFYTKTHTVYDYDVQIPFLLWGCYNCSTIISQSWNVRVIHKIPNLSWKDSIPQEIFRVKVFRCEFFVQSTDVNVFF